MTSTLVTPSEGSTTSIEAPPVDGVLFGAFVSLSFEREPVDFLLVAPFFLLTGLFLLTGPSPPGQEPTWLAP